MLYTLDKLCMTRVGKTRLKEAKSFPAAERVTVRLRVQVPACGLKEQFHIFPFPQAILA